MENSARKSFSRNLKLIHFGGWKSFAYTYICVIIYVSLLRRNTRDSPENGCGGGGDDDGGECIVNIHPSNYYSF